MEDREILFLRLALQKGYLDRKAVDFVLQMVNNYKNQGKHITIFQVLLHTKDNQQTIITEEKIREILTLCDNYPFAEEHDSDKTIAETDSTMAMDDPGIAEFIQTKLLQKESLPDLGDQQTFSHYHLEREIGRGGMGVVYRAYDTKLKRTVALKVLLAGENVSDTNMQRFIREALSMGRLDHNNIVRVFEVGEEPKPHFTMEYIDGIDFSTMLKQEKIPTAKIAIIIKKVAGALHFVHRHGIVHRDVKPSNIMIKYRKEPVLMDFGLAKTEEAGLSNSGDFLGTPSYMSPEQVNKQEIDARSDIYSLGATLYQALTGRIPFEGETLYNIIFQICNRDPVPPRKLNPDISPDLEAICLKCMEKSPSKRYHNAKALERDLIHFLEDRPVKAKPATPLTFLLKSLRRNKTLASVISVSILIMVSSLVYFVWNLKNAKEKAQTAEKNVRHQKEKLVIALKNVIKAKEKAESAKKQMNRMNQKLLLENLKKHEALDMAQKNLYYTNIILANSYCDDYDIKTSEVVLNQCPPQLRSWEWYWLKRRQHNELKTIKLPLENYMGVNPHVEQCRYDKKNNRIIAVANLTYEHHAMKRWVLAIDPLNEKIKTYFFDDEIAGAYALGEQGRIFANVKSTATDIELWLLPERQKIFQQNFKEKIVFCNISPRGNYLAVVTQNKLDITLTIWDIKQKKLLKKKEKITAPFSCCSFSPDEKIMAYSSQKRRQGLVPFQDHTIKLWPWQSKSPAKILSGHKGKINAIHFSANGKFFATGSSDNSLKIWDINGNLIHVLTDHKGDIVDARFSRDNTFVASTGDDQSIKIWDVYNGTLLGTLLGHRTGITSCAFGRDNEIISGDIAKNIKIWSLTQSFVPKNIKGLGYIFSSLFSADGKIHVFTIDRKYEKYFSEGKIHESIRKLFSEKGYQLSNYCSVKKNGKNWLIENEEKTLSIDKHKDGFHVMRQVFFTHESTGIFLREWPSGKIIRSLPIFKAYQAIISRDGKLLAVTSKSGTISLWNSIEGKKIWQQDGHKTIIGQSAFSPDEKYLVTVSEDKTIKLWDIVDGKLLWQRQETNKILACSFNTNGNKLYYAVGNLLKIWDFSQKTISGIIPTPNQIKHCDNFSYGGGEILALSSSDYSLKIWFHKKSLLFSTKIKNPPIEQWQEIFQQNGKTLSKNTTIHQTEIGIMLQDHYLRKLYLIKPHKDHSEIWLEASFGNCVGHSKPIFHFDFNNKKNRIVTAGSDNAVILWDLEYAKRILEKNYQSSEVVATTMQPILTLRGHYRNVNHAVFYPGDKFIISSSDDRTVKLWEAKFSNESSE